MSPLDTIKSPIAKDLEQFNKIFDSTLHSSDPTLGKIFSAIGERKGKLMRPILLLLVARELGEVSQATFLSAVTLEMLHTASLIHDDVVDESDERRGHASINALFGNQVAVLAGDYLLSTSLLKACDTLNLDIVRRISKLGMELSSGEILQLHNACVDGFSEQNYFDVIKLKTAALFAMSAELGAVSVGAPENRVTEMRNLGQIIGMCFQIRDDIFDYYDDPKIGKPTGNDMAEGKLTLPVLYALKTCQDEHMIQLAQKVKNGGVTTSEIATLIAFTKRQGGIEYAEQVMRKMTAEATAIAQTFNNEPIRQSTLRYIDFVTERSL
ncbi:MAG: polyprenyl synthetase family protein [Prevotellaceae bacterium]|nr:polyprenyl synthetase family protein [Prevotellaceae bacterium]MDY3856238.1 polyprenyl synthetase family protein [Bacteroidaceae bacterium]